MGRYEIATGRVPKEEPEPVKPSKKKELKDGQVVRTIPIIPRRTNRNNVIYSTSSSVSELNNMSSEEISRLWPTE